MNWFNYYGLIFVAIILIPNIIYAIKFKNGFENNYKNKAAEVLEQTSRYACIALMIFNVPYTWFGFYFDCAEIIYIVANATLVAAYCLTWIILWKKSGLTKALLLSVIPALVFVFSGVMIASIPLAAFAVIFAVTHVLISVKNATVADNAQKS